MRSGWTKGLLAVVARPALWPTAIAVLASLAPTRWWTRRPWLPLPDPAFLGFRLTTAFGPDQSAPPAREVVSFLRWRRAWPRVARR